MAVTVEEFAEYVGLEPTDPRLSPSLTTAVDLLSDVLGWSSVAIPESVRGQITLEVAHEIYKRADSTSGGSASVDYGTGQAVLGPRDPLTRVWPMIRRYVMPF